MRKIFNKKLKNSSKQWIARQIDDEFVQQKKIHGFRSRSAFKLLEIEEKFKILKNKRFILDLGSTPGGWSQVLSEKVKKGKILAIDILPMEKIDNVDFILGDFLEEDIKKRIFKIFHNKIDVVISDMASNTTGNKNLDSFRTAELSLSAMEFSRIILNDEGIFLSKLFMGQEFIEIQKKANKIFKRVTFFKPRASRKDSREIYMICKNFIRKL